MVSLKPFVSTPLVYVPECMPFSIELCHKLDKYEIDGNLNDSSCLMSMKVNFHIFFCIWCFSNRLIMSLFMYS